MVSYLEAISDEDEAVRAAADGSILEYNGYHVASHCPPARMARRGGQPASLHRRPRIADRVMPLLSDHS